MLMTKTNTYTNIFVNSLLVLLNIITTVIFFGIFNILMFGYLSMWWHMVIASLVLLVSPFVFVFTLFYLKEWWLLSTIVINFFVSLSSIYIIIYFFESNLNRLR